ncbi:hypothetical protein [Luteithermobacter gelatinilyticus]|uniref:hypothetical protein n=1 Tax=Luteithermobacter gelatinilyticus TaxID=2582913 RepID=UPI001105BDF4|nr:hypothetical protein [Luteithermobacter gelatinilyticus]|tara:strand:- start:5943 stop:6323 length:381 start_codon:yes stop_codon:yes gene_type:complete
MKKLLISHNNPDKRRDYVISLRKIVTFNHNSYVFTLRYVPDKLILQHGAFDDYLEQCQILGQLPEWTTPEGLALHVLEDIMDEIVPKWVGLSIVRKGEDGGLEVKIAVEDRQPQWHDEALLQRLAV